MADQAMLTPKAHTGAKVGREGQPIPTPIYLVAANPDERETDRVVIINCALYDVRSLERGATSKRVAEWIDCYLTYWESLATPPVAPSPSSPSER